MIILLGLALVGLTLVMGELSGRAATFDRDDRTSRALALARDALIGYAAARGDITGTARPGELPCPDTNADGLEESSCTAGRLGRVPWKTLGIEPPRDADGEVIWYAPAGPFRKSSSIINSDTRGDLVVRAADGTTTLTAQAAFVLLAPGAPLPGQDRSSASVPCATTGTTITASNCASNYLESAAGVSNAVNGGPFISAPRSDTYNDRTLYVDTRDLMAVVEKRVAHVALAMLSAYKAANGYLPFPARSNSPGCTDSSYISDCGSDQSVCRGRFPQVASSTGGMLTTPDWPSMAQPSWFSVNLWGETIYYGVGTSSLAPTATPPNCSAGATVNGTSVVGVIFSPGTPAPGVTRPSIVLADYLSDAANQDGWTGTAPAADAYVTPTSGSPNRIYSYP